MQKTLHYIAWSTEAGVTCDPEGAGLAPKRVQVIASGPTLLPIRISSLYPTQQIRTSSDLINIHNLLGTYTPWNPHCPHLKA